MRDCQELFARLNETLSASWERMYEKAQQFYKENGNLEVPKKFTTADGFNLGNWIDTQRKVYNAKVAGVLTVEQITKLESIGMRWKNMKDLSWDKYYQAAKEYYAEHGDLMPSITDRSYKGVKLSRWIAQLRTYRKSGICPSYLTPERIGQLDAIGMVWNVPDYIFEKKLCVLPGVLPGTREFGYSPKVCCEGWHSSRHLGQRHPMCRPQPVILQRYTVDGFTKVPIGRNRVCLGTKETHFVEAVL